MKPYYLFIIIAISTRIVPAQGVLQQLPDTEKEAVEAVALYPLQERNAVLTVSQYPEVLVRMDQVRQRTETAFTSLISVVPEAEQKKIYNLSRYPELLATLAERDTRWPSQDLDIILESYAAEIHEDARDLNRSYFPLLRDIHALDLQAEADFVTILALYPEEVRDAARQLAQMPAVLSVLTQHMSMTVLLGDLYRRHPTQLNHELDSLHLILAEEKARELEDWKKQLEENPEALGEFQQAANEFAGEESTYDDDVYGGPVPSRYRDDVYEQHVWRPYLYWFGWPSWYGYECWYPYPWWYHRGYYYGPGQVIVIISLPSHYFFDWHFRHHRHFYHYPHFTDHVFRHYYGPRHYGTRVQPVLRQWEQEHRGELPAGWMNDDKDRVNRIREYGKFRIEYDEVVKKSPQLAPTTREYLRDHADRYPTLKPVLKEKPEPPRSQPPSQMPRTKTVPPQREPTPDAPAEKNPDRQKVPPQEEVDKARETHKTIWDQMNREPKTQPQSPPRKEPSTAPPRKEPTKKEKPRQEPPSRKRDG